VTRTGPRAKPGFTLVELMITAAIMVIVGLAIGVVIVDGQIGWNVMYDRINSDVSMDGYAARKRFDAVMRSASRAQFAFADDDSWVEVYAYASSASTTADRYWRFYVSDGDLDLEYGQLEPRTTLNVETVCGNVSACTFKQTGQAIQMTLTLESGTQTSTIVSSAVTHNE